MPERRTTTRMGLACVLAAAALLGTVLGGCKDQRPSLNDPGDENPQQGNTVDSEFLFATTAISAGILRFQNTVIDTLVRYVASGEPFPYEVVADVGTGKMTFFAATGGIHNVTFDAYNDFEVEPLLTTITGSMRIRLDEISPGLDYTINPGEEDVTFPQDTFVLYQLPTEFDSARLRVSGTVRGVMDASAARQEGFVHQTGTIRLDENVQGILLVESLAIEYPYDALLTPSFDSPWPAGSYELGLFFLLGAQPPINITFDGHGGASIPFQGGVCNVNLDDLENGNPCQQN
jgi:hypothetical protein